MTNDKQLGKTGRATRTVAVVAGMLAAPMMLANAGLAQSAMSRTAAPGAKAPAPKAYIKFSSIYIKLSGSYDLAGEDNGHTVFRDAKGRYFYLDGATGDMKFLTGSHYLKCCAPVAILGTDANGNTIMKNAAGQTFYLDPANGNIVLAEVANPK
jgi:hypothetical protein